MTWRRRIWAPSRVAISRASLRAAWFSSVKSKGTRILWNMPLSYRAAGLPAPERPSEAGGAALGLPGDLPAAVGPHLAAGRLQPPPGDGVALEHDAAARGKREDVRPLGGEFLGGDLDQADAALLQELPEGDREERQVG